MIMAFITFWWRVGCEILLATYPKAISAHQERSGILRYCDSWYAAQSVHIKNIYYMTISVQRLSKISLQRYGSFRFLKLFQLKEWQSRFQLFLHNNVLGNNEKLKAFLLKFDPLVQQCNLLCRPAQQSEGNSDEFSNHHKSDIFT